MSRDRARIIGSAVVVATCLVLCILSFSGRLAYTQGTSLQPLEDLSKAHIWTNVFALTTLFGLFAFRRQSMMVDAMGLAAGAIGAWALVNWMWGLTAVNSVSLAGPALATALSALAWTLARAWAVTDGRGG